MANIFLTSDTHFNHNKDFILGPRGFDTVEQMNCEIVKRWNAVVQPEDTVYLLGDVMLGDVEEGLKLLKQLNGNIYIAYGNHCTDARIAKYKECHNVKDVQMGYRLKKGKKTFILTHYPTLVANGEGPSPIWNIHGHTHSANAFSDVFQAYNVNMEAHNCTPVNINKILEDIKER